MNGLKFTTLDDGSLEIEGVGIPFGGPIDGKDLHGQFFSAKTDFAWDLITDGQRPLLYQHGLDSTLKTNVIGRWSVKKIDEAGVWVRAQLDARSAYLNEIKDLLGADALGLSSATMGHLVKVAAKTGEILRWPVVELSLTPNPANPAAYVVKTAEEIEAPEYVSAKLAILGEPEPDEVPAPESEPTPEEVPAAKDTTVVVAADAEMGASEDEDYDNDDWETWGDVAKHAASTLIEVLELTDVVVGDETMKAALDAVVTPLLAFITACEQYATAGTPLPSSVEDAELAEQAEYAPTPATDPAVPEVQPAASLAIIAGTDAESVKADLARLKEQIRAIAREAAHQTLKGR